MLKKNIESTLNLTVTFRENRSIKQMKKMNLKYIENKWNFKKSVFEMVKLISLEPNISWIGGTKYRYNMESNQNSIGQNNHD